VNEQVRLLKKEHNEPIIIVSTNIAEESITIDYVDAVIDL
jgi:HrpA-like RNA helicase